MRYLAILLTFPLVLGCTDSTPIDKAIYDKTWPSAHESWLDAPFAAVLEEVKGRRGPQIDVLVTNMTDLRWEMSRGCFVIIETIVHRDSRPPKRNKLRRVLPPKRRTVVAEVAPEYFRPFDPGETQREGVTGFDPWVEIVDARLRAPCH